MLIFCIMKIWVLLYLSSALSAGVFAAGINPFEIEKNKKRKKNIDQQEGRRVNGSLAFKLQEVVEGYINHR